jgi:chlorophyll synthase
MLSLAVGAALGASILGATAVGLALAWAYSAPPLRLKTNGWFGNAAVGLCYEGLPWFTGAAALCHGTPSAYVVTLAILYSLGAFGIMVLNDFKAVEGDVAMGIRTLPVQLGVARAVRLASTVMLAPQLVVIAMLARSERPVHAALVAALVGEQLAMSPRLWREPRKQAPFYNATGTTAYVLGMLVAAFAARSLVMTAG